ncbi:hypothetical protein SDRG_14073 [Saprolegnia diclina VS20]|uniref:CDT1 Geminin-binding domain-containing protein n=1 Tax=Saprolegnia diclina (strain VS20) TaxID=1156394 RepID=T0Q490_SAPDV|nr:hypothetical protein SDRG_14073 [Saprolegnia diclina VS20]EQC28250.1 hypothetical protein SDRG_14073 [Saprolegnia diclina VS20]|eukprot:XP_008618399.1 hypothetical protein SDRG_14073 [Saprolegnia diclina VS20]
MPSAMKRAGEAAPATDAKRVKVDAPAIDAKPSVAGTPYAEYALSEHAPPQLVTLVQLFASLEFSITTLNLYKRTPSFSALRRAIESSAKCTFSEHELAQLLTLLPNAYELSFSKAPDNHKVPLELCVSVPEALASLSFRERMEAFCSAVNDRIALALTTGTADLTTIEIPPAALPRLEDALGPTPLDQLRAQEERHASELTPLQQAAVLAKPIPKELQGLPLWLVNKVRLAEHRKAHLVEKADVASSERLLQTLPQLADQLQSYSKCVNKSAILLPTLLAELTRAPIPERLQEHVELLAKKAPFWVTLVPLEKTFVVRLNWKQDFRAVKKILSS